MLRGSLIRKGTFGYQTLGLIKYFAETLGSFVKCLVWRLESLVFSSILVDLCISNIFAGCHPFSEGSVWVGALL